MTLITRMIRVQVTNPLRDDAVAAKFPAGESLREGELAERFGVSRLLNGVGTCTTVLANKTPGANLQHGHADAVALTAFWIQNGKTELGCSRFCSFEDVPNSPFQSKGFSSRSIVIGGDSETRRWSLSLRSRRSTAL